VSAQVIGLFDFTRLKNPKLNNTGDLCAFWALMGFMPK
jgi:hypothetical protein